MVEVLMLTAMVIMVLGSHVGAAMLLARVFRPQPPQTGEQTAGGTTIEELMDKLEEPAPQPQTIEELKADIDRMVDEELVRTARDRGLTQPNPRATLKAWPGPDRPPTRRRHG